MANLGQAIANQGVFKPEDPTVPFFRGLQIGDVERQRKEAQSRKIDDILSKSVGLQPDKFIPALYGAAKDETTKFYRTAYDLKKKYGSNFVFSQEFNQLKNDTDFKLKNLEAESQRFRELDKGAQEGKLSVDPKYLQAGRGTYQDWLNYKNELTGFGVDPNTGLSNVGAAPKVDYKALVDLYFKDAPYTDKVPGTDRIALGNKRQALFAIPQSEVERRLNLIAQNHPESVQSVMLERGDDVKKELQKLQVMAASRGEQLDPKAAIHQAAMTVLQRSLPYEPQKPLYDEIPQRKEKGPDLSGVSDVTPGSVVSKADIYEKGKGGKLVRTENVVHESEFGFTAPPTPAAVANTGNVFNINGERLTDPDVVKATYGDYKLLPVYKKGTKESHSGNNMGGRLVSPNVLAEEEKKGVVEYVPMAIGTYTRSVPAGGINIVTGKPNYTTETVDIYRPMQEVSGAVISGGKNEDARNKIAANYEELKRQAKLKNEQLSKGKTGTQNTNQTTSEMELSGKIDPSTLKKGSIYRVSGKRYIWNGTKLVPQ